MFGIGSTELMVILFVALLVLGPKKLPGIARSLGKGLGEMKRMSSDFQRTINADLERDEMERRKREAEQELLEKREATAKAEKEAAEAKATGEPKAEAASAEQPAEDGKSA